MGRNGIKIAATLFVVALAGGGYAAGASAAARRTAVANSSIDAHTSYSRYCASCHGEDGDAKTEKGELYGATDFTSKQWWDKERPSDARLRRAISAGKSGGMPAFGKRISAAEIRALATFLRGFKGR
ncbi:MAG TPA: c-type cytochrome [Pyrinomonadaceae bacterium]|jgi:mono/diheme cytochrome c family protein|nr:c-type cytochrome [Pyrinomonadaceae bacterium]